MKEKMIVVDGNLAVAKAAYKFTEVAGIYPITPSSNMGE
jgi:pyruvate-ferredoxin/flavodoxin oxidoreductase